FGHLMRNWRFEEVSRISERKERRKICYAHLLVHHGLETPQAGPVRRQLDLPGYGFVIREGLAVRVEQTSRTFKENLAILCVGWRRKAGVFAVVAQIHGTIRRFLNDDAASRPHLVLALVLPKGSARPTCDALAIRIRPDDGIFCEEQSGHDRTNACRVESNLA